VKTTKATNIKSLYLTAKKWLKKKKVRGKAIAGRMAQNSFRNKFIRLAIILKEKKKWKTIIFIEDQVAIYEQQEIQ
jgi:hypothetical protein